MKAHTTVAAQPEPTSRFSEINGLKLHYLDWGGDEAKHTFLLLHGGAAHAHWWDGVAPPLTPFGRVLALDFRGHGQSQWPEPPVYGPAVYIEDLKKFIEQLGTRVIVAGHSMGGAVAQWTAAERPDLLKALIIVDAPPGRPPLWRRLVWRWSRKVQGGTRPELDSAESLTRKFRLSPPGTYLSPQALSRLALSGAEQMPNGRWTFRFDPETRAWRRMKVPPHQPRLRRITTPTLILRGAESTMVRRWTARSMHRKIAGSVFREIPRAFHHVPLDNPSGTAAAIVEFVESI